jgi:rubrerythrin
MEKFSIREVIEQAVQTERLGYDFYTAAAKRFRENEKLVKLFDILAGQELRHEKVFSQLKEKIKDENPEDWEEASRYLRAIVESEFFLGRNKSLTSIEDLKSVEDAVQHALGFEKETLLYYYSLKDVVKEKEILNEIIEEEKSHIRWLSEFKKAL